MDQSQLMNAEGFSFSGYERDPLYLSLAGQRFMDISGVSGIDSISDGRAGVFADFDNDGDLDVFVTTIQGEAHLLFRNNVGQDNRWLRVALEGKGPGRDAFGAVARLRTSAGTLTKIKSGGAGFISQHDPRLLFGLGADQQVEGLEVTWPDGTVEVFRAPLRAGQSVLLRQGSGTVEVVSEKAARLPDPLTAAESAARNLKVRVGQPLPDLPVQTLRGAATTLRQHLKPGRTTLVNLWATWCVPCAAEMPELERLRARLAAKGIDVLGLNVDTEPGADIGGFARERRVSYPILMGGVAAVERLYATDTLTVPLSLLVDETGTVRAIIPGWSVASRHKLEEMAGGAAPRPANGRR